MVLVTLPSRSQLRSDSKVACVHIASAVGIFQFVFQATKHQMISQNIASDIEHVWGLEFNP